MAKQVKWTKKVLEEFIELAMLSEDEIYIMQTRVKDVPISVQAQTLNVSESTIHRKIALLKKKYDAVQKEHPDIFPVRKESAKETWMDNH